MKLVNSRGGPLGILILIAWAALIPSLSPLPAFEIEALRESYVNGSAANTQPDKRAVNGERSLSEQETQEQVTFVSVRIWIQWLMNLLFVTAGIFAGAMALFRLKHWVFLNAVMSVLYLIMFFLQFQLIGKPFLETWLSWAQIITYRGEVNEIMSFFAARLIVPIFHLCLIVHLLNNRGQSDLTHES